VARSLTYYRLLPYNPSNEASNSHQDMPSPTKDTKKPKLNREILEDENVYFYEHVHTRNSLPKWLRPIHWQMRFMRTKVPRSGRKRIVAELKAFQRSGQDGATASASRWSLRPFSSNGEYLPEESFGEDKLAVETGNVLNDCLRVKKLAISLRERNEMEPNWATFLRAEFFKTYMEVHGIPDEHRYAHLQQF
jgi:hypothetical protein